MMVLTRQKLSMGQPRFLEASWRSFWTGNQLIPAVFLKCYHSSGSPVGGSSGPLEGVVVLSGLGIVVWFWSFHELLFI